MPILESWELNQVNTITFVMVDGSNTEVPGLGAGFTMTISKNGGFLNPSAGTKSEIGNGWYKYVATAGEADTVGTISIVVTGAGCIQQNLEYVVFQRNAGCLDYTYIVNDSTTGFPMFGAEVWISTDGIAPPQDIVWYGNTDALGVARDTHSKLPCLDANYTYYVWKQHTAYIDDQNPDPIFVS
jgi:hypothetical protein